MKRTLPYIPVLFLILGALLRVVTIGSASLWYDEAITLYRSTIPFMDLFTNMTDQSGCLILDLLLRITSLINNHSVILLRVPSLLAGLASIWLAYKLMVRLEFTLEQKIGASLLITFLPGLLWMGTDARSYGIVSLILLGALWFALDPDWLGLVACCGLAMYAHTTAGMYAMGIFCIAFYLHHRLDRKVILSGIAIAISWVPALVRILDHGDMQRTALQPWAAVLTGNWFLHSALIGIWVDASTHIYFFIGAFIILAFTLPLILSKRYSSVKFILTSSWLFPLIFITLASLAVENVIQYRTLMPLLFPFCLWLGWILLERPVTFPKFFLAISWLTILIASAFIYKPSARGADLDKVAAQIRSEFRPGDLLVYSTSTAFMATDHYLGDLPYYQWKIPSNWLLSEPGIHVPDTGDPSLARRVWLFYPRDPLITPPEVSRIQAIIPVGQLPLYTLQYLQTSNIEIYLLDPAPTIK